MRAIVGHVASVPGPCGGLRQRKPLKRFDFDHLYALTMAVQPIQARMSDDSTRLSPSLWGLVQEVGMRLGDPRLNAASARRGAGIADASILRRFRREAGVSLSWYIRDRRIETAARLSYTSDLPLQGIASMLGFASEGALTRAIEHWATRCF